MFSHNARNPGVDLRTLRYINALNVTFDPLVGEIRRRIFHRIWIDVRDAHCGAALRENLGRGETDSAGTTSDAKDAAQ
ncbi:hypothetical protein LMH87_007502 [Akanthomyces muscarius]|uniref:Uncharacterized protein n=1 Tax=Akanthomyces muscarius TaxID=2231603 RepID=A0A9W8UU37_AKAMU|nr:hypothetical protein LMH87_007502 [Akanthomyces muscarius]KAJ4165893.1 hypothetical protein LMH87_007502 [Akanthomyces muscarius]